MSRENPSAAELQRDALEAFATAAEAAVAELITLIPEGFGPLEFVLAAQIKAAAQELRNCAEQLAADPLMVAGSTGQRRAHPLLKVAQDLRREITGALKALTFQADQRGRMVRLNRAHQARRLPGKEQEGSS